MHPHSNRFHPSGRLWRARTYEDFETAYTITPNSCEIETMKPIYELMREYATVGDELKLPAGTYSVYVIAWGKREVSEHNGNLTDYFAKTVLTVK